MDISLAEINAVLAYDPETGAFTRLKNGRPAGSKTADGYIDLKVNGKRVYAHRLAWFVSHGRWPKNEIDHINGIRHDNRIANLRDVSRSVNRSNTFKAKGVSGLVGVTPAGRKWEATIQPIGYLGLFATKELAHEAYQSARKKLERKRERQMRREERARLKEIEMCRAAIARLAAAE